MSRRSERKNSLQLDAITLRQVRYFVAVASAPSLTAASEALRVSQPAVGQQIRQLEAALGLDLIARHSRGFQLTPAGRRWLPAAKGILRAVGDAGETARDLSGRGWIELRLGVTPSVARSLLPHLLYRASLAGGRLRITFFEGLSEELIEMVAADSLDIAFGYNTRGLERVDVHDFALEDLCIVGPLSLIGTGAEPFAANQLARLPLVLGKKPNRIRARLEKGLSGLGLSVEPVVELDLAGLKRDFLLGRDYCAVSPRGLFLSDIREGRLGGRPIAMDETRQALCLITREGLPEAHLAALYEAIDAVLAEEIVPQDLCWTLHPSIQRE